MRAAAVNQLRGRAAGFPEASASSLKYLI